MTVWVGGDERPVFLEQARWLSEAWGCGLVIDDGRHHFDVVDGLETPDSGAVLQMSEPPANSLNPLTYIFQDFALLPWRSVASVFASKDERE